MDREYIEERIAKIKARIEIYEDALSVIASGVFSYTIDTGQGRQTVTRQSVGQMESALNTLYNDLDVFYARLNGGSIVAN